MFLKDPHHHGNLCHRFKEEERHAVMAEIPLEETTTGVDVGMREVVRPVGSHRKRYPNEVSFNETTRETQERGKQILKDINNRPCAAEGRESLPEIEKHLKTVLSERRHHEKVKLQVENE